MFKTMITLMRGATWQAEEELADRSALLILGQQIRDAAAAIECSKRALALAIAQDEAEGKRLDATLKRIADLEERAIAALGGGREDLAGEAAEAIAVMEADRDAIREARSTFAAEIRKLKSTVANANNRLAELERGRRIAVAAESVRRLETTAVGHGSVGASASSLAEAEATLRRLRDRQAECAATESALESLDSAVTSTNVADRLEAAGFGRRTRPSPADVLSRLRAQATGKTAPPVQP